MPSHPVWYCCHCNYGPLNVSIDMHCASCGQARCDNCVYQMATSRRTVYCSNMDPHSTAMLMAQESHRQATVFPEHDMVPRPAPMAPSTRPRTPPPLVLESTTRMTTTDHHAMLHHPGAMQQRPTSDAYYCCKCNDGPKLYSVQPQCVQCGHQACAFCSSA
ncbi:hypothetical protein VTN49DRAFT_5082 [Thermomyces lanuginosus]|uniref:uncharacterized protein n=1 Tax=Thermomyces lanuginosus TaxID=5541 RepID=UPI003744ACD0